MINSEIANNHYIIKKKRLEWTIPKMLHNLKMMLMFMVKLLIFSIDSTLVLLCINAATVRRNFPAAQGTYNNIHFTKKWHMN
jgi:hypothetical protein